VTDNDIADWYENAVGTRRKQLIREMASEGKTAQEIDQAMDNKLSRREIIKQLQQEFKPSDVRRFVLGDRIYSEIYHGEIKKPLPEGFTQENYGRQLGSAKGQRLSLSKDAAVWKMSDGKGYIMEENGWQVRQSEALLDETAVKTGKDIRRFYFNVKPEKAAELADFLTTQLKDGGVKFNLKLPMELEGKGVNFNRPDSLVMYVEKADYQAVKKMVLEYSKAHPEAFAEGTPAFTKAIGKGIAAAEEPLQGAGLPGNLRGAYSHGQLRSDLIAQTIVDAPPGVRNVDILQLARQRMHWHDLDVNRPWLSKGTNADDL
jgi:HopA1 effector protein family